MKSPLFSFPIHGYLLLLVLFSGCAVNPVTGTRDFVLITEDQEIQMGKEANQAIQESMPQYEDTAVRQYVEELTLAITAKSERPNLNWAVGIIDDPTPNAFALPGGYLYVTRGLLTHVSSEAELVSVLSHEIAHVTARHAVTRISRMQMAQIGLGVSGAFSDKIARYQGALGASAGLLFLKYGRGQEDQADEVGLRYMVEQGYNPHAMPEVFATFERMQNMNTGSDLPNFLSTHPNPGKRVHHAKKRIEKMEADLDFSTFRVGESDYLKKVDGMVFGINPRHGYFRDQTFLHPDMRFTLRFPGNWKTANMASSVTAVSPTKDAIIRLTISNEDSLASAKETFFSDDQTHEEGSADHPAGRNGKSFFFRAGSEQHPVKGIVSLIDYRGNILVLVGFTKSSLFSAYESDVSSSLLSFTKLTDGKVLNVKPHRLRLVKLKRNMTLEAFRDAYAPQTDNSLVALINHVEPDATLEKGGTYKGVRGKRFP